MFPTEKHSLKAINRLQRKFPYAATLLTYAVLERCLKLHLLKSRKTLIDPQFNLRVTANKMTLKDACALGDKELIEFLTDCTLSKLEQIYCMDDHRKDNRKDKYSTCRNDVIHSNPFFSDQLDSGYKSRDEQNRAYLKTAKTHLIEASKRYFRQEITESNGSLRFKR